MSDNVGDANWNKLKSFTKGVVNSFRPSWPGNHIAFMSFGDFALAEFKFNRLSGNQLTLDAVRYYIDQIRYRPKGGRRMDIALSKAYEDLFNLDGERIDSRKVT